MKLRILDNSIRLRLTRGEVRTLAGDGLVSARTAFPGGRTLVYRLESSPASVKPEAFLSESEISVRLPEQTVLGWAATEQVSIEGEQATGGGDALRILVEKDFACLAPRDDEDESDMFQHPEADTSR